MGVFLWEEVENMNENRPSFREIVNRSAIIIGEQGYIGKGDPRLTVELIAVEGPTSRANNRERLVYSADIVIAEQEKK